MTEVLFFSLKRKSYIIINKLDFYKIKNQKKVVEIINNLSNLF